MSLNLKYSEESDIDSPRGSPTIRNELTTNFGHNTSEEFRRVEVMPNIDVEDLLRESEYLVQFESWSSYKKDSRDLTASAIKKENLTWELVSGERNYLQHLYRLKIIYKDKMPMTYKDKEELFPNLERMIQLHSRLFKSLLRKHKEDLDIVHLGIGRVFLEEIDSHTRDVFQQIYGEFSYSYGGELRHKAKQIQSNPSNAAFFSNVQMLDPDHKKGIDGYLLIINQRWTKVEPLIDSIREVTMENEIESEELEMARELVSSILSGSQSYMMKIKNEDILRKIKQGFRYIPDVNVSISIKEAEQWIFDNLHSPDLELENYDRLKIVHNKRMYHVYMIALKRGFFLLSDGPSPGTYCLTRLDDTDQPMVVKWGIDKAIFREVAASNLNWFLIVDYNYNDSRIYEMHSSTPDECQRWKQIISKGLEVSKIDRNSIEVKYREEKNRIDSDYKKNLTELSHLTRLDNELVTAIDSRNTFLQNFFNSDFIKTIEDLSLTRKSSTQDKKEVTRTSSGSGLIGGTVRKPPLAHENSMGDTRVISRSNGSIDLRRNCPDLDKLLLYCGDFIREIQDRKSINITRSISYIEDKQNGRSDSKPRSNFNLFKTPHKNGSRKNKPSGDTLDNENDYTLAPEDKTDEATFRERILVIAKKINDSGSNLAMEMVKQNEELIKLRIELDNMKKENRNLEDYRENFEKHVINENPKDDTRIRLELNELEKLREKQADFEKKCKNWQAGQEKQKVKLERKEMEIKSEKEKLAQREKLLEEELAKLDDEKRNLQNFYDFHNIGKTSISPSNSFEYSDKSFKHKNSFMSTKSSDFYTEKELDNLNNIDYYNKIAPVTDLPETLQYSKLNQTKSMSILDKSKTISRSRNSLAEPNVHQSQLPMNLAKKKKTKGFF